LTVDLFEWVHVVNTLLHFLITTHYQSEHDNSINLNKTAVEQNFILQKTSWLSVNDVNSLSADAVSADPISLQNSMICNFHSRSEQMEWHNVHFLSSYIPAM
jgi:hypothetical protein